MWGVKKSPHPRRGAAGRLGGAEDQFALGLDRLPDDRGDDRAGQRRGDEDPEVGHGGSLGEEGGAEAAGGVDAGAREVDAENVDQDERQTDGEAGELIVAGLGGDAEDRQHERGGEHGLDGEAFHHVAAIQRIGAEAAVPAAEVAEQGRAGRGAGELGDHVADKVAEAHAAGQQHAQRDGGIDVAAGNVADGIGHGDDRQAERQRRAQIGGVDLRAVAAQHDGRAAAEKHEHERADKFSEILFHS